MIRAVCFDAGATLLHPDPPVEEVYARVFREDGARFSPEGLRDALLATWMEVQAQKPGDRYGGVSGEEKFWRAFLERVRERLDGGRVSAAVHARLANADGAILAMHAKQAPAVDQEGLQALDAGGLHATGPALIRAARQRRRSPCASARPRRG